MELSEVSILLNLCLQGLKLIAHKIAGAHIQVPLHLWCAVRFSVSIQKKSHVKAVFIFYLSSRR